MDSPEGQLDGIKALWTLFFPPRSQCFLGQMDPIHPLVRQVTQLQGESRGMLKWLLSSLWYNNQMKTKMKQSDYLAQRDLRKKKKDFSVPGGSGAWLKFSTVCECSTIFLPGLKCTILFVEPLFGSECFDLFSFHGELTGCNIFMA